MPSFDSVGNPIDVEQNFVEVSGLSATTGQTLVPLLDVGAYRRFSLQLTGTWNGILIFRGCNTGVLADLQTLFAVNLATGVYVGNATSNGIYGGAINYRYMQISWLTWTSGTVNGVLELYYSSSPLDMFFAAQFQNGTTLAPAGADQNGTIQQVSLYGKNVTPGDVPVKVSSGGALSATLIGGGANIGNINNDGTSTTTVAAGKTTDTVIKNSNGRLCSILVITLGTNAMQIFDNATTGSGLIIGLVPASSPANGVIIAPKMPAANGITVNGNANNPAVTIAWT